MKISRKNIGILLIFLFFILIELVSLTIYQTASLAEESFNNNKLEIEKIIENEEVNLTQEEQITLELINKYRKENNLSELKTYPRLQEVAKKKAEDLVNNHYFAHYSEKLGTPFEMIENNGITYKIAGENLAGNTTPEKAVESWINSKTHRENILEDRFQYTGIYIIESPVYGKIYVQLFIGV